MSTEFPPEVLEFKQLAREFGTELRAAEIAIDRIADPEQAYTSDVYRSIMAKVFRLGIPRLTLPKEKGGLGVPMAARRFINEEITLAAPGLSTTIGMASLAPNMIVNFGLDQRHPAYKDYLERWLDDAEGVHTSCWAITEPEAGSDVFEFNDPKIRLRTKAQHSDTKRVLATREGGGYVIDGGKSAFVSNGWLADFILLMAAVDLDAGMEGTGVFLIPGDLPGITKGKPLDKLGLRALNQSEIFFDSVWVPEEMLVSPPGAVYPRMLENIVTGGNTGVGMIAWAVAQSAFEEGLRYAKERIQGGKPIIQHQAIALKIFDAYRWIQASRALLDRSAVEHDMKLSFAARAVAAETAMKVTAEMVQVLGGYGISKEYTVEKLYRDAKLLQIMDGTVERTGLAAVERM